MSERVSDEELDDIIADEYSPNQRQTDLLARECQQSRKRIAELEKRMPYVQHLPGCRLGCQRECDHWCPKCESPLEYVIDAGKPTISSCGKCGGVLHLVYFYKEKCTCGLSALIGGEG